MYSSIPCWNTFVSKFKDERFVKRVKTGHARLQAFEKRKREQHSFVVKQLTETMNTDLKEIESIGKDMFKEYDQVEVEVEVMQVDDDFFE
jgi:hypothetical protein